MRQTYGGFLGELTKEAKLKGGKKSLRVMALN